MLQDQLHHLTEQINEATHSRLRRVLDELIHDWQRQQLARRSLAVGDTVPNFTLQNHHYRSVTLYDRLDDGPVILSFFRGGWCPYCNLELRALRHARPRAEHRGAQLLAITPESPSEQTSTAAAGPSGIQPVAGNRSGVGSPVPSSARVRAC